MSKNLYDEAIAEAKLLRDTAEQNAKNAIIEAVTPRIRTFIEEQLIGNRSEGGASDVLDDVILDMSDDSPGDKNVILDESALESLLTLFGTDDLTKGESSSAVRGVLRESFNALDGKQQQKLLLAANKLNESIDFFEESGIPNDIREKREISRMPRNDEVLYEVDLDELSGLLGDVDFDNNTHNISENEMSNDEMKAMLSQLGFDDLLNEETLQIDLGDLELEDDALDALRDALSRATITLGGEEEVEEEEVEVEVEEEEGEGGEEDFAAFGEEEAGEDLAEVFEIDEDLLRSELNRLRTHLHEAKDFTKVKGIKNDMKDSWGGKGHGNVGVKSSYGGKSGGNAGVKGAFGGGKEVGDPLKVTLNKLSEAVHNERRKNRALASRLNEYRSAVETLREQLTDLNLFNAKLLYVNKLLQNKDITSSQRRSVVESIDGAKTLREVKMLYRSLTESFKKGSSRLSESRTRRVLGSSSSMTSRGSAQSAAGEVDRWATLAGLKE